MGHVGTGVYFKSRHAGFLERSPATFDWPPGWTLKADVRRCQNQLAVFPYFVVVMVALDPANERPANLPFLKRPAQVAIDFFSAVVLVVTVPGCRRVLMHFGHQHGRQRARLALFPAAGNSSVDSLAVAPVLDRFGF